MTRADQFISASVVFAIVVMPLLIWHLACDGRPLDFASSPATRRWTTLLVALIFLNGVAASLAVVLDELNSQIWTQLFAWVAVVLVLQALIVYVGLSRVRRPKTHLVHYPLTFLALSPGLVSEPSAELLHRDQNRSPNAEVGKLGQELAERPLTDPKGLGGLPWPQREP